MCRRNGRGGREILAARKPRQARIRRGEALGGWGWRRSMGIWEVGPTVIVYSPAPRETETHRLPIAVILPGRVGAQCPD